MPVRIQRQRKKGWKMPPNTVYVGRGSKWGNPFKPRELTPRSRRKAASLYRSWINGRLTGARMLKTFKATSPCDLVAWMAHMVMARTFLIKDLHELKGKNLACWCPADQPCHADVLLELANKG